MKFGKAALKWLLRHPLPRLAAIRLAAARRHGLVLVYHRIRADGDLGHDEVTPSVEQWRLRAQLAALAKLGDIVDLRRMLDWSSADKRPRFAITFDDDYPQHTAHALPVLRELDAPAAFFLSGRALHGLGPYWWSQLEALVAADGIASVGQAVGIAARTAQELAVACEAHAAVRRRLIDLAPRTAEPVLDGVGIRALADAGMTIGFHTLEHPVLPPLEDEPLRQALQCGRAELARAVGTPIDLFAYPHGKTSARVAQATRAAGYRAAWTGAPRASRRGDDAYSLGRWEPGPLDVDAFGAAIALRLHRLS